MQVENLAARLENPPTWLRDFVAQTVTCTSVGRACALITGLGRLLQDGQSTHPQALLERARRPGRSMGSLARALEVFFTEHAMAVATDQRETRATERRRRRIAETPEVLQDGIIEFERSLLRARDRARRSGTRPRADTTIETALSIVRDFARCAASDRGKHNWALIDDPDVEAFLGRLPRSRRRRLAVLGQFFRFARTQRLVLVNPTRGLKAHEPRGFSGATLTLPQQRQVFHRWNTEPSVHPHEALLGMLALLHGVSNEEFRLAQVTDIDMGARTIRLGRRPHPVPLDPASWSALERCLLHRKALGTSNPHLIITRATKADARQASPAYVTHLLDPTGFSPRTIRGTRILAMVNTMDPKLVAVAMGMTADATVGYLADHVDPDRLPAQPRMPPRTW